MRLAGFALMALAAAGRPEVARMMTRVRCHQTLNGVIGKTYGKPLCANVGETPFYPLINEQGGKDDNLCW